MNPNVAMQNELKSKFEDRTARIGIVGMGYVGLPLALLFSEQRFPVTGFDIDQQKVAALNSGGSYIVRILPAEIQGAQKSGFLATSDYSQHQPHGRHHHLRPHPAERVSRA